MGSNPCRISGCDEWVHNSDSACVSHYNELQDKLTAATKKIEALENGYRFLYADMVFGTETDNTLKEILGDKLFTELLTETEEKS